MIWNLNKENGWKDYKSLTEANDRLKAAADNTTDTTTKLMSDIEKELTKVKFKAFGKVKVRSRPKEDRILSELQKEKELLTINGQIGKEALALIDNKMNKRIMCIHSETLVNEIEKLKDISLKKGRSAMIFKLKDEVIGKKVTSQEPIVMYDSDSNVMLKDRKQIRDASLNYCVSLLTNRPPKDKYFDDVALVNKIHEVRMKTRESDEIKLNRMMFDDSLSALASKHQNKYKFILNGGEQLKSALFNLCVRVWETEIIPEQWKKTTVIQIYKGKGNMNEFSNQRNIHTKHEIPKLFGSILMSQVKQTLIDKMSKFQLGTKPGHRAQEHLFSVKSVISLYDTFGIPLILQLYDVSKFFDRESLRDGMNSVYHSG